MCIKIKHIYILEVKLLGRNIYLKCNIFPNSPPKSFVLMYTV